MKHVIFAMAGLILLLFGCVTLQVPEGNETAGELTHVELPVAEENGSVETFSIESVDGAFRHMDYEFYDNSNPFSDSAGGDLGKTSTAYIKVDEGNLGFLSGGCNEQEQAFWFNLKTREGKGVVFEAVYSMDLAEDCETVKFLGNEYEVEIIEKPESTRNRIVRGGTIKLKGEDSAITLKDGGNLNNDDKWPVVLGWKDGKLVKIIVYMGGYFYDVEADTNIVPLFDSRNSVLARFTNMETNPTFELITTDMSEVKKLAEEDEYVSDVQEINFTMYNEIIAHGPLHHTEYSRVDDDGIYIEFNPALQTLVPTYTGEDTRTDGYEWNIDILGVDYKLVSLDSKNSSISLAREISSPCQVNESNFSRVGDEVDCSDGSFYRMIYNGMAEEKLIHLAGRITLKDGEDGVELTWNYQKTSNPELKSISIPANSYIYGEIEKQSNENINFSRTSVVHDEYVGVMYEMSESINDSGIYLEFYPPLALCVHCSPDRMDDNNDFLTETHRMEIPILDESYIVSCLKLNDSINSSKICLASEEEYERLWGFDGSLKRIEYQNGSNITVYNYISTPGKTYVLSPDSWWNNATLCDLSLLEALGVSEMSCQSNFSLANGEGIPLAEGGFIHSWHSLVAYDGSAYAEISYFSDVILLEDGVDGIELNWTEKTLGDEKELMTIVNGSVVRRWGREEVDIPGLKSVFIPANGSAYEKLTN